MKNEREFLRLLEVRAKEERLVFESSILPAWAARAGDWLAINPWRVMIPIALVSYLVLRLVGGEIVREAVLAIFGGFRW
jgi:anti-sigma-K factor RskA